MDERPPSDIPASETETRDWHPDDNGKDDTPTLEWTSDECDALQVYIDQIKDLLGLHGWNIYLAVNEADADTNASVHVVFGRRVVPMSFNKNWWSYTPEDQRNTVVHELLHIVHHFQSEVIRVAGPSLDVWRNFEMHTEFMVDHLAGVIEDYMPLPVTPKEIAEHRANRTGPFSGN